MRVGVPTEIKNNEFRVALTPAGAHALVQHGHEVLVQKGAGLGSAIPDTDYQTAGATIVETAADVWGSADMILKVKEPIECEYDSMREGQILFTYLHLAADEPLTQALLDKKVTSIAYETVQMPDRSLPLLSPMSEIAGRLSVQVGANALLKFSGGNGTLLGGASGVRRGKVVVLGGGTAGLCAAELALGMGAEVSVYDVNVGRMRYIEEISGRRILTHYSSPLAVEEAVTGADLVIGSVLIPGAKTPKLVTNAMVKNMPAGSVLVDIAIDQGGCFEDSHATTHADPVFAVHDSIFYCVANMPGAVPHTSTFALTNSTMRYCTLLADKGWQKACQERSELAKGFTTHEGALFSAPVAEAFALDCADVASVL